MEVEIIYKALLSLGVVFVIMYLILKIAQKYTNIGSTSGAKAGASSLKIENVVYIDQNNKVVTISNELGSNYVLAIGKHNSFLIEKYTKDKKLKAGTDEKKQ